MGIALGDCMEERHHLLRGELFRGTENFMEEREPFSRTEKETEWRFCRAQIVRSLDAYIFSRLHFRPPTSFVGCLHFSYCLIKCLIL